MFSSGTELSAGRNANTRSGGITITYTQCARIHTHTRTRAHTKLLRKSKQKVSKVLMYRNSEQDTRGLSLPHKNTKTNSGA